MGVDYFHKGQIDEFAIWTDVLSDKEIQDLYFYQKSTFNELAASWTPKWDNLIGYWNMEGNWQDSSSNKNHGSSINGSAIISESKIGSQSSSFDGSNDYVQIEDSPELSGMSEFSFSTWVYLNSKSNFDSFIEKINTSGSDDTYKISLDSFSDQRFRFSIWNNLGGARTLTSIDPRSHRNLGSFIWNLWP